MKTLIQSQRDFFNTNQTKNIDFRITQLLKLRKLLQANEQILNEAIYADFQKSAFDTYTPRSTKVCVK
jgi:aldehyde dehydrogenase (NAD+)